MGNSHPPDGARPAKPRPESKPPDSRPPENAKVNDTWLDDYGDLYTYDGKDWVLFEDVPYFEPDIPFRLDS